MVSRVRGCLLAVAALSGLLAGGGCDFRPADGAGRGPTRSNASVEAVWLETGTGPGQTVYPRAIARDPATGWLYLVDRQGHIQRLDAEGRHLSGFFMPNVQLGKPVGLSVGPDGNLYVADTHYHRVVVYSPEGAEIRRWGSEGNGPGQFVYPTDIAFHDGRVFVSEYGDNDRIQVFTSTGEFLYQFGRFGQDADAFSRPQSIVILGDELFVADACNHRIQVYAVDGSFRRSLGRVGQGDGEFRFPYGLVADPNGMLIVTEFGNNRIQRIDPRTGTGKGVWGIGGRGDGELAFPWAAEVDSTGRVIIVDSGNNRLQVLRGF
jgi:DNA-binding beta-propeller fold protein YncE